MPARAKDIKMRRNPKQKRSRDMVESILDATAHVLVTEGYDHASTNRIADRAGVSIGSLYQYFPNKQSLVSALNAQLAEREYEVIRAKFQGLRGVPLGEAIREIVGAMVDSHRVQPKLHRVLVEQVPHDQDRERREAIDAQIFSMVRGHLKDEYGLHGEQAELAVFVIFNVVESLTHQAVLYRPEFLNDGRLANEMTLLLETYLTTKLERAGSA